MTCRNARFSVAVASACVSRARSAVGQVASVGPTIDAVTQGENEFLVQLAGICWAAADLVLKPVAQPSEPGAHPEAQYVAEGRYWKDRYGTDEPMRWVSEVTSTYVAEAAHQVRAVGVLLATGVATSSLDPLVRAVVERGGRVKWIFDPDISPEQRAARAGLEIGASMTAYRMTLERLKADKALWNDWKDRVTTHRERLQEFFPVEKAPLDPCDPKSKLSEDMRVWVVAGEPYPNYGTNAGYALETETTTQAQGKATYDVLSGFSHPSVVFSREHRSVGEGGEVTFTHPYSTLERAARFAAFGLADAFRHWAAYYGAGFEAVEEKIDELGVRMDEISVINDAPPEG